MTLVTCCEAFGVPHRGFGRGRGRCPPAPRSARGRPRRHLLPEQLEVNHHRVERILDFVRHAGRETSERDELARVPKRRLHLAQVLEIARDQHDPDHRRSRR